jgi:ABC-2 type transport system ATP-binding protein
VSAILADRRLVRHVDDSNRYLEVELADGADPQELLRRVVSAGAMVHRFELIQPSLHQIFLDRVGATGVEDGMSGHG